MAVGQGSLHSTYSYVGIGRETTLGTYVTSTAGIDFISASIVTAQEGLILEEVTSRRVPSNRITLSKNISGSIEYYYTPVKSSNNYILQQAFGGAITSATSTGETVGGGAFDHTIELGNMDNTYTSLSMNIRKGDSTNGKVFEYMGMRVNELVISAEIDDALKMNATFVGFDSTNTTNDVQSALSQTTYQPLTFVNGRISVENSFASLTSTSFWHVQSFEMTVSNSLKSDTGSRRIGSNILDVLPAGMATIGLTLNIRFDTTTAWDAMQAGTQLSAQLEFAGATISGSAKQYGLLLNLPKIYVNEAGDPEIGGPDELLTSAVTFHVLHDDSSASGYAIQAVVTNEVANYN